MNDDRWIKARFAGEPLPGIVRDTFVPARDRRLLDYATSSHDVDTPSPGILRERSKLKYGGWGINRTVFLL